MKEQVQHWWSLEYPPLVSVAVHSKSVTISVIAENRSVVLQVPNSEIEETALRIEEAVRLMRSARHAADYAEAEGRG